ncbi:MAG: hypothetical protein IPO94_13740 [Saprospiraceae bacterium]|nr:hypothetical protein [Saprospiraceae bacterium]
MALYANCYNGCHWFVGVIGLKDGERIRLVFNFGGGYYPSIMGTNNGSSVQFVQVPACNTGLVLSLIVTCNAATEILTTCFVQGATTLRPNEPTIVGVEYGFNSASPVRKFKCMAKQGLFGALRGKVKHRRYFLLLS